MARLEHYPVHLGRGGTAIPQPKFEGGLAWYEIYAATHESEGADGRLVSLFHFDAPWTSWEMHPAGAELVVCTSGRITLHQEGAGGIVTTVALGPGDYAINPPGVWHTADVGPDGADALFVTPGIGTEHRPR